MEYQGLYSILGPPGTGKTTFLAGQVKRLVDQDYRPLLCSLTRTAAAELAGRDLPIEENLIGTLHAHAFRSLGEAVVAESKLHAFSEAFPEYKLSGDDKDTDDPEWEWSIGRTAGDHLLEQYQVLRARRVEREVWPQDVLAFAEAFEDWKHSGGMMDFTDMIECAFYDVENPPGDPQVMIVDECQDLSRLEAALVRKWGAKVEAIMASGDPYQALYTWRGADPVNFFGDDIPADHRKVLHQSYRVPRAVHAVSMKLARKVSYYQPFDYQPRDCDGMIQSCEATWQMPDAAIKLAEEAISQGKTCMIQTACSFFLTDIVTKLRDRGIPFSNPWRFKRGDWNPLRMGGRGVSMSRRIADFLARDMAAGEQRIEAWTAEDMAHWTAVLTAEGVLKRGAKKKIEIAVKTGRGEISETTLFEWFEGEVIGELIQMIGERYVTLDQKYKLSDVLNWFLKRVLPSKKKATDYPAKTCLKYGYASLTEPPRLYVGTIHSFKGGQADRVILFPDLSPSGFREWSTVEGRDSILRMFYVALTRAREEVVLCTPASAMSINLKGLI